MFGHVLDEYRIIYIGRGNMPTTADQAVYKIGVILAALHRDYGVCFEEGKFTGITPQVLLRWYAGMVSRELKMATRNNYVLLLNPFLSWAVDMEYLESPGRKPIYEVLKSGKLPKEEEIPEEQRKEKSFTVDQVRMLMNSISGMNASRDRAIVALFLASGLRVSELCSLTLRSVLEQERGTLYVKRKGGAWKHTEVSDFFYKYLDEYLDSRDLSDLSQPLFLTIRGTPCNRQQIWDVISRKEKALGITSGVHILRHTTLSNLEKKGGASITRDVANHSSFATTNRYVHTSHEERLEAINSLDWNDL